MACIQTALLELAAPGFKARGNSALKHCYSSFFALFLKPCDNVINIFPNSVIYSNVLKEVSSAQQGSIYLYRKKYKPDSGRGSQKWPKNIILLTYSFEVKLCFVGIMSDRMYTNFQC